MQFNYYKKIEYVSWAGIFVFIIFNFLFWAYAKPIQARWTNVPPVPSQFTASSFGFGDKQLSYRMNALMLQNLGDIGGKTTNLASYNYEALVRWFFLQDYLDSRSNHIPYLAAYYFGGVEDSKKIAPIIDYLEYAGASTEGEKWRWLAQAAYLARFRMKDIERAKSITQKLVNLDRELPSWVYKMPAMIALEENDKQAAYAIMLETLKSSSEKLHPNEVYDMQYTICTRILTPKEAKENPLCENIDL